MFLKLQKLKSDEAFSQKILTGIDGDSEKRTSPLSENNSVIWIFNLCDMIAGVAKFSLLRKRI